MNSFPRNYPIMDDDTHVDRAWRSPSASPRVRARQNSATDTTAPMEFRNDSQEGSSTVSSDDVTPRSESNTSSVPEITPRSEETGDVTLIVPTKPKTRPRLKRSQSENFMHSWDYTPINAVPKKEPAPKARLRNEGAMLRNSFMSVPNLAEVAKPNLRSSTSMYTIDKQFESEIAAATSVRHLSASFSMDTISLTRRTPKTDNPDEEKEEELQPVYETGKDGRLYLIAGTLSQLVHELAPDMTSVVNNEYIHNFLLTHRYFIESLELLRHLRARYDMDPPTEFASTQEEEQWTQSLLMIRLRIVNALKKWLENPFFCFADDADLSDEFKSFMIDLSQRGGKETEWAGHLMRVFGTPRISPYDLYMQQQKETEKTQAKTKKERKQREAHAPIVPAGIEVGQLSFLQCHPLEVARQLTLIDYEMFVSIKPHELFRCAWTKKNKMENAPNVVEFTSRFNSISFWIASEIVTTANHSQRVEVLSRMIQVAEHLLQMNNFHGVMEFYAAFNMGSVQRLKMTWKDVSEKYKKKLKVIEDFLNSGGNWKRYREACSTATPPIIPIMAVILSDLTSFEEIPDHLENGLINFEKMTHVARLIRGIERFQSIPYPFAMVNVIQHYLTQDLLVLEENELYKLSKQCEGAFVTGGASVKHRDRPRSGNFFGSIRSKKGSQRKSLPSSGGSSPDGSPTSKKKDKKKKKKSQLSVSTSSAPARRQTMS